MSYHRFTVVFIIVLGGWTLFHLSPLVDNFLHDVVIIAVFVSKERHIVVDVAVPIRDSIKQNFWRLPYLTGDQIKWHPLYIHYLLLARLTLASVGSCSLAKL